jgi:Nif-specific regulatory protein
MKNAIERAVVMGNGLEIRPEDLPNFPVKPQYPGMKIGLTLKEATDRFKKDFIALNLKHTNGNRSLAAKKMEIQRTYLSRLIAKYELQDM